MLPEYFNFLRVSAAESAVILPPTITILSLKLVFEL